ncbi:MAG: family 43 glycosylhydrolase [Tannerella sp.]|nr:family 43 glycosylhydrolase [Tannerella sp.]
MSLVFGLQQAGAQTKQPNIVFFIADDCRRQDLGCYGSVDAVTPNIDRLASQGLKFNNFFQATAMSSPTRQRPKEELYDVQNDPFQMNNLAGNPQHAKTRASLRDKLYQLMEQQGDKGQQTEMEALEHPASALAYEYGSADTRNPGTRIPDCVEPAIDCWLRDTWVTAGPDGYFYMTGTIARKTTGAPHCWDWNSGIPLWRSSDLKSWDDMGLIWTFDKDGTWQQKPFIEKEENMPRLSVNGDTLDNNFRALWAPEIHYIKSLKNWFIVACVNNSAVGKGSFILKSVTGKPEGPYVNIEGNRDKPIFPRIDGSLFEDTDGTVYFIGHNHHIARMKPDMSGFAEELRELQETKYPVEPYIEGASIIKHDGKYFLLQAIWSNRMPDGSETYSVKRNNETCHSYDCVIAAADNICGPYGKRENVLTGGGHNILFQDKNGTWRATVFYNPRGSQAKEFKQTCRPALVPMKYENGRFLPDMEGCAEYSSQR